MSRKRQRELVTEAIRLVESKQPDKARKKLSDASREDPESIRANFLSGLIYVFDRGISVAAKARVLRMRAGGSTIMSPR